ncbi:hypothetical protein [Niabella sp.]|uniref:hypothetical protein n=1 Tax=Niabella sp. TaxID=1962976 RepID=UPI002601AFFD|nr:hypothetical protein [Niabella sp.]
MTTKIKTTLSAIGWYQLAGGVTGALMILYAFFKQPPAGLNLLIYLLMLLFFAYSFFCGICCLKHKDHALTHAFINQSLQLIGFAALGFAFSYTAGVYVSIGLDLSNAFNIKLGAGISKFTFNINREHARSEISLNLAALWLIYRIDKLKKAISTANENTAIASISE